MYVWLCFIHFVLMYVYMVKLYGHLQPGSDSIHIPSTDLLCPRPVHADEDNPYSHRLSMQTQALLSQLGNGELLKTLPVYNPLCTRN